MSARTRTAILLLVNKNFLLKALENLKVDYTLQGEDIIAKMPSYFGELKFVKEGHVYRFVNDSPGAPGFFPLIPYISRLSFTYWQTKSFFIAEGFFMMVREEYTKVEREYRKELRQLKEKQGLLEEELKLHKEDQTALEQKVKEEEVRRIAEEIQKREEELRLDKEKKAAIIKEQMERIEQRAKEGGFKVVKRQKGNEVEFVLVRERQKVAS